ncbi:MAG: glycosyltransferase family 9 protein, partial [Dehalococcoidales bacterium]|nr:glycosyltransferase family 9 protein [Dehalococcoidales bacterium]
MTQRSQASRFRAAPSSPQTGRHAFRLLFLRILGLVTAPLVPTRGQPLDAARVLVIRPDHLGDALFTSPALRALRQILPASEITCLVGPWAASVYRRYPYADKVVECEFPAFSGRAKGSPWRPYSVLLATAKELRAEQYDLALNLRFDFWWGALLAHDAAVPLRLGYAQPECRPFLNRPVGYEPGRHEVAQNLKLVGALVADDPLERARWLEAALAGARLDFPLTDAEREAAVAILETVGGSGRPIVAIHPGTRGRAKLWTADGWAAVGDALVAGLGATVIITGSGDESGLCAEVAGRMKHEVAVIAGRTTVGELVALFERCSLVLGVDSGPLHMAVAAGTPTVHLF